MSTAKRCHWRTHLVLEPEGTPGDSLHGGYCRGVHALMEGIAETGSMLAATKELNMAYSKAWKLIHDVERDFGVCLIETLGPHGSAITEEGLRLMESYQEALERIEHAEDEWAKNGYNSF